MGVAVAGCCVCEVGVLVDVCGWGDQNEWMKQCWWIEVVDEVE